MVGVPAAVGLALVAPELVLTLLGERWMATVPFIQIMGCINILWALSASGMYLLFALGRAKMTALQTWSQVVMFVALALLLIPEGGAMAIAKLRLGVAAAGLLTFVYLIRRERKSWQLGEMLSCVWRPCAAAALMASALIALPDMTFLPAVVQLLLKTTLGVVVYAAAVLLLWWMGGRREGAEAYLLGKLRTILKRWNG